VKKDVECLKVVRNIVFMTQFRSLIIENLSSLLLFLNEAGALQQKHEIPDGNLDASATAMLVRDAYYKMMEKSKDGPQKKKRDDILAKAVERDSNKAVTIFSKVFSVREQFSAQFGSLINPVLSDLSTIMGSSKRKLFGDPLGSKTAPYLWKLDEAILRGTFVVQIPPSYIDLNCENTSRSQLLGSGKFGDVLKGSLYGQKLAFKHMSLSQDMGPNLSTVARGEIFTEIQHKWRVYTQANILKLFGVLIIGDICYLTFERMGISLHKVMHGGPGMKKYRLKQRDIVSIGLGVASGLSFLHDEGILFYGLHPGNILLPFSEKESKFKVKPGDVKLTDFGSKILKREMSSASESTALHLKRDVYLSPEVLQNNYWLRASDTYSFGVVWWEMTQDDKIPFEGVKDVLNKVVTEGSRPEFVDRKRVGSMRPKIEQCWTNNPWDRPSDRSLISYFGKVLADFEKQRASVTRQFQGVSPRVESLNPNRQSARQYNSEFTTSKPGRSSVDTDGKSVAVSRIMSTNRLSSNRRSVRMSTKGSVPSLANGARSLRMSVRTSFNSTSTGRESMVSLIQQTHGFLDASTATMTTSDVIRMVRTMNSHFKDAVVQLRAIINIRNLAQNESLAEWLVGLGVGKAVLRAMKTHKKSAELVGASCGAFCNLSFSPKSSQVLMKSGVAKSVIAAMKHYQNDAVVQEEGLKALINLEYGDMQRKEALLDLGAPELVLQALATHISIPRVVVEACAAIASLQECFIHRSDEFSVEYDELEDFYTMQAVPRIIRAMQIHASIPDVQAEAFEALKAICLLPWQDGRKLHILENGVAPVIATAMSQFIHDADMQLTGCALIAAIGSTENTRVTDKMIDSRLPECVIQAMVKNCTPDDEDIQIRGIFALYNITLGKKQMAKFLTSKKVKQVLDATMKKFKSSKQLKVNATALKKLLQKNGKVPK